MTAVVLAAAGIGLWIHPDWWRAVTLVSLAASCVWFSPWFTFIEVVNAALARRVLGFEQ